MAKVQTIPVHRPIGPFQTNWESYIALCSPTHKGVHRWERFRKFNLKRVEWAGKVICVRDRSAIIEMDFLKDEQPIEITLNFTQPQIFQEYSEELEIHDPLQYRPFSFRAIIILQDYTKPPKFNLAPRNKSTEPDYTLTFSTFASEVYGDSKTSESVYFETIFKNRFVTLVGGLQGYAEQRIDGKILKTVNFAHYPTEQEYRLPSYGAEEAVEFFTDNADLAKKCSDAALNHTVHEIRAKFVELGQGLSAHKLEMVYISDPLPGLSAIGSVTNNKYLERLQKRLSGMSQSTTQMGQSLNPNIPVDQSVSKSMTASGTPKKIIKQNELQSQYIPVNASQALQMQMSNNPALIQSNINPMQPTYTHPQPQAPLGAFGPSHSTFNQSMMLNQPTQTSTYPQYPQVMAASAPVFPQQQQVQQQPFGPGNAIMQQQQQLQGQQQAGIQTQPGQGAQPAGGNVPTPASSWVGPGQKVYGNKK